MPELPPLELTMHQEFQYTLMKNQVENLPIEDLQESVLSLVKQLMIKDNVIRHLIKQSTFN